MTIDPEFEAAAYAEFTRVMGDAGLNAIRQMVALLGPGFATLQSASVLGLSDNDTKIFKAVAFKLHREAA